MRCLFIVGYKFYNSKTNFPEGLVDPAQVISDIDHLLCLLAVDL